MIASLLVVAGCAVPTGGGGDARPRDYTAFLQACKDATTDAVVMNLAAHPDDEAARSLVFLRRKYGIRTVTVYSTCGEGGQNAIGPEIGLDLARIRTRETLAAAKFTGTQVRWLGFADFGYSKTAKEAFAVWGREDYLARLKAIVDAEMPDVVLTNHSPQRGHGHHRASVLAVREVLEEKAKTGRVIPVYQRASRSEMPLPTPPPGSKAETQPGAKPKTQPGAKPETQPGAKPETQPGAKPETQPGAKPETQPGAKAKPDAKPVGKPDRKPAVARTRRRRGPIQADIKFDVGEVDYMTGLTYARQATLGWRQHKTQGVMGMFSSSRRLPDSWQLVHPKKGNGSRFYSMLGSLFDEPAFQKVAVAKGLDVARVKKDFDEFHKVLPAAEHIARARQLLPALERLVGHLGDILAETRLQRRIDALQRVVMEGASVTVRATIARETLCPGSRGEIDVRVAGGVHALSAWIGEKKIQGIRGRVDVPFGPLTGLDTASVAPSWFRPKVRFDIAGLTITREVPVRFTAVPCVSLSLERPVRFVPSTANGKQLEASVGITWNGGEELASSLRVESANGFDVQVENASVQLESSAKTDRKVRIALPKAMKNGEEAIVLALESGKSELVLRPIDVKAPKDLFVGLIRGKDDTLKLALQDLGIPFEDLGADTLGQADLAKFNTIVIDIRAYRTRMDLRKQRDRILARCKDGARVLCFYHKPNEWNANKERPLLAPYPLTVGRGRVCEEDAVVVLTDPAHRLWNHPNKIGAADFDGWVQERGLNFPAKWDKRWTPLMKMSDTGEKPLDGAMLHATYGEGDYIYCSLALYRQLRRGHAGAARLLVNLLSK